MKNFKTKNFIIWIYIGLYVFLIFANPAFCLPCFKSENQPAFKSNQIRCICCHEKEIANKNHANVLKTCNHCVKPPILPNSKEKTGLSSQQNLNMIEKISGFNAFNFNLVVFKDNKNSINLIKSYLPLNLNLSILRTIVLLT